jgi:dipeptidyl aminopeptidase/acylaminoacyl peptidase
VADRIPGYVDSTDHVGYASRPDLAVFLNGEFDLPDLVRRKSLIADMEVFLGASLDRCPALYEQLSPMTWAGAGMPPTLLLHGDDDACVPHGQSVAFHERLRRAGVPTELEVYPGKGHGWFNREPDHAAVLARVERFLVNSFDLA